MANATTIQIDKAILEELKSVKDYPEQTYNSLLIKMLEIFKLTKKQRAQYDEFLHKIQQVKMKELWDNPEDEAWQNV